MLAQKPGTIRVAVKTNERMLPEGVQVAWCAMRLQVATVGKQSKSNLPDVSSDQRGLDWAYHADRDIDLAPQQVLWPV
jgi:hypothetical protein